MRAICMVYRDKKDLQRLREEYEKAEKPPLDLSLKPSFMKKDGMKTEISPILSISPRIQPIVINIGPTDNITFVDQDNLKSLKLRY